MQYNRAMDYIFNTAKLEALISDFYISTGIAITLYDASQTVVTKSPVFSGCCTCIRTKEACVISCDRSNQIHMEIAAEQKSTHSYTCHAGLMETITPILYEGIVIAYLQIGQFRDETQVYSSPEKIRATARKHGYPEAELLQLYEALPIISKDKLRALLNIINILIRSFWEDGLIQRHRSMLSVKISQYIDERINEKIYIEEICEQFSISKFSLYALFREEFQSTVNEFILKRRITLACQLLQQRKDWNITRIASACGFADYNYFIRVFKDRTGTTPRKYREAADHA